MVVGPQGEFLYRAPKDEEVAQVVTVSLGRSEQVRRWWPFLRDRRIEAYNDITKRYID
jgi:N-carbamoylputrescine amidase